MPTASNEKKPQASQALQESRSKPVVSILLTCLVILAGIYSPWILLVSFALLPSLLVRMVDKSENHFLSFSVTGLNIMGLLLALQHSYNTYGSSPRPGMLFQDWVNWVLPFGSAWLGVLFFMAFPIVFAAVMEITLQHKERRLKDQQKILLKVWGTQLGQKTTAPPKQDERDDDKSEKEKGEKE